MSMSEQLLLVNPKRRRRRKTPARDSSGRFLKRRSNPHRSHKRRHRRRNPVPSTLSLMNPRKRRHRRRRNPVAVSRRRYRRNPSVRGILGNFTRPLMPAIVGAGGAVVSDVAFGFLPLPANLKVGNLAILSRAIVAVGLGMLVSQFVSRRIGEQMTAGALTVQAHQYLAPFMLQLLPTTAAPAAGTAGIGYYGAGYGLQEYIPNAGGFSAIPDSMSDSQFYSRDQLTEYIPN